MNEEKKKKNKIIGISIGILVVLLVVISSTYAYWQITKSQDDPNKIIAACLDFDVDFPVGITEENKWPMSSSEAMSTIDGYTFTVTNNCPEDVTYVIGLESVTSDNITSYLSDTSVGIGFDGVNKGTYSSLTDLEGPTIDARGSKKLQTAIVKGKSDVEGENVNTHNLKLWIDETSDVEEQSKGFSGKLFITGGQKIENDNPNILTAESCFEITEEGEIIGYDEACGESVVIPATVNGAKVKTIDSNAFRETIITNHYFDAEGEEVDTLSVPNANIAFVADSYTPGGSIDLENLLYVILLTDDTAVSDLATQMNYTTYIDGEEPDLEVGQIKVYQNLDTTTIESTDEGYEYKTSETKISITGLDLSQAYNLSKIEARAFSNVENIVGMSEEEQDSYNPENYPLSLTSLTFGENTNAIEIGYGAFNRIDVDELIMYTTYYSEPLTSLDELAVLEDFSWGFLYGSHIDKLIIKPTQGETVLLSTKYGLDLYGLYDHIYVKDLIISEGITELGSTAFYLQGAEDGTLSLPSTLTAIGYGAFIGIPYKSVTIPSNVISIGENAFYNYPNKYLETITIKRSEEDFLANVTVGSNWNNGATLIYAP